MTDTETSTTAAPMRLRAEPPRVTRLSRKVLASAAAVALVGIGGALIYALQTHAPGGSGEELYSTTSRQAADGLAGLPKDYTGPVLGPALPGDLGRPILNAQNAGQPVAAPVVPTPRVDEAEQRRRAEEEAARTSTVFFQARSGSTPGTNTMPGLPGIDMAAQPGQATAQDKQLAFLNAAADRRTVTPDRVTPPASPFILQAGAVIPAALITGIRSDLPGQITAQVTEPIYDSPTGRILLVPQGTRIIGQYDNNVQFGQRRVLLRLEDLLGTVLGRRDDQAERRRQHIAELERRAVESDMRLKRLYDAIEAGVADVDDPALKERIVGLKVIRDQARADADRAQALLDSPGHSAITPTMIQGFAHRARERIRGSEGGYRRDHLRALAQRVEVADDAIRIMGSKTELLRTLVAATGGKSAAIGVPRSGLKWRRRRLPSVRLKLLIVNTYLPAASARANNRSHQRRI